jgi:UDP-N-acetylglucosamine--N-acetylmuramyl-(pentapeptide) pyrophosphoryl-undecaprenol N-acetylglucosamine transferase
VLEQNAVPGLTNRWLARIVGAAAVAYEETLPFFRGRGFVAGNPVRAEFFDTPDVDVESTRPSRVLVLGGSQGAHAVNVAMVAAAPELVRRHPQLELVHQTGERDLAWVQQGYDAAGVRARAAAFLDPVVGEVSAADLVVGRAGATTLAELAAAGRPAVLIPFPAATDDHQRKNAAVVAEAGGAVVIDEHDLTARLADVTAALAGDRARLRSMGRAMRKLARPDAAERIVSRALALVGDPGGSPRG